ncbi:Anaerobic nitric oxide reductase flavorubredoxin [compost metagenome]
MNQYKAALTCPESPPEAAALERRLIDEVVTMKKWQCVVCGLVYDESLGWPDDGIAAGTRWEDVPQDWICPDCGVGKLDFEMIEIN